MKNNYKPTDFSDFNVRNPYNLTSLHESDSKSIFIQNWEYLPKNTVKISESEYRYVDKSNMHNINEGNLVRAFDSMKSKDFAIVTAFRSNFSDEENIFRNRKLKHILNNNKLGTYKLVGHWQEAPDGVNYDDSKPEQLTDSVEQSFLIPKRNDLSRDDFIKIIVECLTIDNETQDAAVIGFNDKSIENDNRFGTYLIYTDKSAQNDIDKIKLDKIGDVPTLGKIAQAYSNFIKKSGSRKWFSTKDLLDKHKDMSFVFEGVEVPMTNVGKIIYSKYNNKW